MTNATKALTAIVVTLVANTPFLARAQTSFAADFSVPAFQQVDQNGVDLVTGVWRLSTPSISFAEGNDKISVGLQWTGQAWTHVDQPSLWLKDGKFTVMYRGGSYEFNGSGSNFSKRVPIDGSSLSCDALTSGNAVSYCRFRSRNGDLVVFSGFYSALSQYGSKFGLSALRFGNVGIQSVLASEAEFGYPAVIRASNRTYFGGNRSWGQQDILNGQPLWDYNYNSVSYTIGLNGNAGLLTQRLILNTPNNKDSADNHYLTPKNTTQTIKDDFGNLWSYVFNGSRLPTLVTQPGGAGNIWATYNGDKKVASINSAAGSWIYTYGSFPLSQYRTTTVADPSGRQTYVRYHKDNGYVVEARDQLSRTTLYNWNDSTRRLESISYPEGNAVFFQYDARGNVVQKTEVGKGGGPVLVWQAAYPADCPNGGNCNQPIYTIDPKGNRTDFEYNAGAIGPSKIIYPAASPDSPRLVVENEYQNGRVVRSRSCMSRASCSGTTDEVIKEYQYNLLRNHGFQSNSPNFSRSYSGATLALTAEKTMAQGQTLLVCHQYDGNGRRVMTTPPSANLSSCPTIFGSTAAPGSNPPDLGSPRSVPVFAD